MASGTRRRGAHAASLHAAATSTTTAAPTAPTTAAIEGAPAAAARNSASSTPVFPEYSLPPTPPEWKSGAPLLPTAQGQGGVFEQQPRSKDTSTSDGLDDAAAALADLAGPAHAIAHHMHQGPSQGGGGGSHADGQSSGHYNAGPPRGRSDSAGGQDVDLNFFLETFLKDVDTFTPGIPGMNVQQHHNMSGGHVDGHHPQHLQHGGWHGHQNPHSPMPQQPMPPHHMGGQGNQSIPPPPTYQMGGGGGYHGAMGPPPAHTHPDHGGMTSGVGTKRSLEDMSSQGRPPPPSHSDSRDDKSQSSNPGDNGSRDNGLSKRMERKRRTEKMRRQEMNERLDELSRVIDLVEIPGQAQMGDGENGAIDKSKENHRVHLLTRAIACLKDLRYAYDCRTTEVMKLALKMQHQGVQAASMAPPPPHASSSELSHSSSASAPDDVSSLDMASDVSMPAVPAVPHEAPSDQGQSQPHEPNQPNQSSQPYQPNQPSQPSMPQQQQDQGQDQGAGQDQGQSADPSQGQGQGNLSNQPQPGMQAAQGQGHGGLSRSYSDSSAAGGTSVASELSGRSQGHMASAFPDADSHVPMMMMMPMWVPRGMKPAVPQIAPISAEMMGVFAADPSTSVPYQHIPRSHDNVPMPVAGPSAGASSSSGSVSHGGGGGNSGGFPGGGSGSGMSGHDWRGMGQEMSHQSYGGGGSGGGSGFGASSLASSSPSAGASAGSSSYSAQAPHVAGGGYYGDGGPHQGKEDEDDGESSSSTGQIAAMAHCA